jgi:hypothetical protein
MAFQRQFDQTRDEFAVADPACLPDTSCSADLPPKMMPTRILGMRMSL